MLPSRPFFQLLQSVCLILLVSPLCRAQTTSVTSDQSTANVFVLEAAGQAVSEPVRDMPTTAEVGPFTVFPRGEAPRSLLMGLMGLLPGESDPALQREITWQPSAPLVNLFSRLSFEGVGAGLVGFTVPGIPPDTNGAVGKTQYVQWVNRSFAVFDKATGNLMKGPVLGNTLWQALGPLPCARFNDGDPVVQYDKLADRWVLSQFIRKANGPPWAECIAVSTSSDATGTFKAYEFDFPDSFVDYPKMGVWSDAYYLSFNAFPSVGFPFGRACAFDRAAMLRGATPVRGVCFSLRSRNPSSAVNSDVFGLLPSDLDGTIPPPPGSPNFFVSLDRNALDLWRFHVDFTTLANSTFTGPIAIPVSPFNLACPSDPSHCIPQLGTTQRLDSLAEGGQVMFRVAYRNFGTHESLLVNHTVEASPGGPAAIRWYEIRSPNGTPTMFQQSTFSPDTDFRWMGSMAMNHTGDLAIGYSISSSTLHPSINIASRSASDPASQLTTEVVMQAGGGSQVPSAQPPDVNRWGDYSDLTVDPVDDCTFWYTNEYLMSDGVFNWHTRIENFQLANCPAAVAPAALPFGGQVVGATSNAQTVTVTNGSTAPLAVSGVTVAGEFSQTNTCTPSIPAGSACTVSITFTPAISGNKDGILTITDSAFSSPQTVPLSGTGEDFAVFGSPSSSTVRAGQTATYTLTITPEGGMFPNPVSFACSGLPALSSCSLSPTSVTPGSDSVASTLAITSTAPVFALVPPISGVGTRTLWVGVLVLVTLGIVTVKRRSLAFALPAAVLAVLLVAQVGCGGGRGGGGPRLVSPGTPAGTYSITVTGTSDPLQHSTTLTLVVQ